MRPFTDLAACEGQPLSTLVSGFPAAVIIRMTRLGQQWLSLRGAVWQGCYLRPSDNMLTGIMWQYNWGTRRELIETYYYLREFHPISRNVYSKEKMFGVREDRKLPPGVWLFETEE